VRSLTIDPKSEAAYVLKGNVLDNLGFPDEAKKTLPCAPGGPALEAISGISISGFAKSDSATARAVKTRGRPGYQSRKTVPYFISQRSRS